MAGRVSARTVGVATVKGYWREADARPVVEAWERSGQTLSRFAAARGVKVARLARWASRLGSGRGERSDHRGGGAAPLKLRFHPVDLVGAAAPLETRVIEVVLLDGRRVRVAAGFATEDLERLLRVLEATRRC